MTEVKPASETQTAATGTTTTGTMKSPTPLERFVEIIEDAASMMSEEEVEEANRKTAVLVHKLHAAHCETCESDRAALAEFRAPKTGTMFWVPRSEYDAERKLRRELQEAVSDHMNAHTPDLIERALDRIEAALARAAERDAEVNK